MNPMRPTASALALGMIGVGIGAWLLATTACFPNPAKPRTNHPPSATPAPQRSKPADSADSFGLVGTWELVEPVEPPNHPAIWQRMNLRADGVFEVETLLLDVPATVRDVPQTAPHVWRMGALRNWSHDTVGTRAYSVGRWQADSLATAECWLTFQLLGSFQGQEPTGSAPALTLTVKAHVQTQRGTSARVLSLSRHPVLAMIAECRWVKTP